MKSLYLIGSLRNPDIPALGNKIRDLGIDVFDDWHGAGPHADDEWKRYEEERGHDYIEGLQGLAARHVFEFDKYHLDRCDIGVLAMPAGKSGHLEIGYLAGQGKPTFVLLEEGIDRWDVMYQFMTGVAQTEEELYELLK